MENRELDDLDLMIQRLIGGWALDWRVLVNEAQYDALFTRLRAAFLAYGEPTEDKLIAATVAGLNVHR